MTQLRESADPSTGFRSNLGLVNPNPYPIRVMLALFDPSGESYGSGSYTLEPLESIQIARVLRAHAVSTLNEGTVEVWSTNPGAVFHAYASVIDNRSGDGIYMPAVLE